MIKIIKWIWSHFSVIIPDKIYLTIMYRLKMGDWINWNNPKTFGEKLQWLKIYNRNDLLTKLVDKYEVKKYVSQIVGEKYVIPTIGVYDSFESIPFENLPERFVMKSTHGSGDYIVCKSKASFNIEFAEKRMNKALKRNSYKWGREWPYKNVPHRIIIEEYIDNGDKELNDYKFFCFDGKVAMYYVTSRDHKCQNFFDINGKELDIADVEYPRNEDEAISVPSKLNEMVEIANRLAKGLVHVRVDLYEVDDKIYVGELTFFDNSGFTKFTPEHYNVDLGNMITIKGN